MVNKPPQICQTQSCFSYVKLTVHATNKSHFFHLHVQVFFLSFHTRRIRKKKMKVWNINLYVFPTKLCFLLSNLKVQYCTHFFLLWNVLQPVCRIRFPFQHVFLYGSGHHEPDPYPAPYPIVIRNHQISTMLICPSSLQYFQLHLSLQFLILKKS
jgi:hypothetical protein